MNSKISNIQVLGSGCPTCKKLFELVKQAVSNLKIGIEVEYITDIQKIIDFGMMSSPVLVINGKAVLAGKILSVKELEEFITSYSEKL
jgi:small redox-active disulfide protein 2